MLENIIIIRNLFYKFFFIGFIFYIFTAMLLLFYNEWVINLIIHIYNLTIPQINLLIAFFIGWTKMIIIFLFLIPAIGLHWTGNSLKRAQKISNIS